MSEVIPFRKGLKPQELVLRFMDSVGHKRDAETYLQIFTSQKPESFAIVVVDEEVLAEDMDAIIFDLRYLVKLSLFPVVVVHASDEALYKYEVESYFQKARLASSFLASDLKPLEKLEFIQNRIKKNSLPFLHVPGEENIFTQVGELANFLNSKKIIFLRRMGGLTNQKTQTQINLINLRFEKEQILKGQLLNQEDERFLQLSDQLIHHCTHKTFVSFVSPINLLRELFTVKGAGTLIQLGSQIQAYQDWKDINKEGLKILLQTSFQKKVNPAFFEQKIDHFYIEENYQGAALLRNLDGMSYLSKFAVGTEARGHGIGRDLWAAVMKGHQKIFWRSNPDNFISNWYVKQCDGMHKAGKWIVFWKGLDPHQITAAIEYALAQPEDFV